MPSKCDMLTPLAKERIIKSCEDKNIKFHGVLEEHKTNNLHLKLECNVCGYYWNTSSVYNFLLKNTKCPNCANVRKKTDSEVLKEINKMCNERNYQFIYFCDNEGNQCEYKNTYTKIRLRCLNCGNEWWVLNFRKFTKGQGCPKCNKYRKKDAKDYLRIVNDVCLEKGVKFLHFSNKNGDEIEWNGVKNTFVTFYCTKCDSFFTKKYEAFINSNYCCSIERYKANSSSMLKDENSISNKIKCICTEKKYEFLGFVSKGGKNINYIGGNKTYLHLKCNQCGKEWKTCSVVNFFSGRGCPNCKKWILETEIETLLNENNIEFEKNKRFAWLENGMEVDFYLHKYNCAIECQGMQHFKPIEHWGGTQSFERQKNNDYAKNKKCLENGIKLLYYSNLGIKYPYQVYEDKEKLLKEILNNEQHSIT